MQGKIIKGIAGFYYVHVEASGVYECKAKGIFRNKNIKPLVGDNVIIQTIDETEHTGNIIDILPRKNELIRPAAANIDQAMVVFSIKTPNPNYYLLDKFLLMMNYQSVMTVICFNKSDLSTDEEIQHLSDIYSSCGCKCIFISAKNNEGIDEVFSALEGKTTILAGPSGVGKSSLTNIILPDIVSETGDISRIGRGRHTTRHSQIFNVHGNTYICDTPGFTSLNLPELEKEELRFYLEEFKDYEGKCRFNGCVHINEPGCAVKEAVNGGIINRTRYDNYINMFEECKNRKKY